VLPLDLNLQRSGRGQEEDSRRGRHYGPRRRGGEKKRKKKKGGEKEEWRIRGLHNEAALAERFGWPALIGATSFHRALTRGKERREKKGEGKGSKDAFLPDFLSYASKRKAPLLQKSSCRRRRREGGGKEEGGEKGGRDVSQRSSLSPGSAV